MQTEYSSETVVHNNPHGATSHKARIFKLIIVLRQCDTKGPKWVEPTTEQVYYQDEGRRALRRNTGARSDIWIPDASLLIIPLNSMQWNFSLQFIIVAMLQAVISINRAQLTIFTWRTYFCVHAGSMSNSLVIHRLKLSHCLNVV